MKEYNCNMFICKNFSGIILIIKIKTNNKKLLSNFM